KWRAEAHIKMKKLAESLVESMGATCEFEIRKGYPYLVNNESLTSSVKNHMIEYLGEENVVDLDLWMAGEDFAFYSQELPACCYRIGTGNESKGTTFPVHTSQFDIDEDALKISAGLMAYLALKNLGNAL